MQVVAWVILVKPNDGHSAVIWVCRTNQIFYNRIIAKSARFCQATFVMACRLMEIFGDIIYIKEEDG